MPSATDNMTYMPLLDLNRVSCNCLDFPRTGGVLQNRNTTEGTSCATEMERLSILEGHSNSGEEDEGEDSEAEVSELEDEIDENPCVSPPNSTVHFVPSQTLFPNDDIQEFTETFTLKGSSFHEHFQNTIRQCKEALKAKESVPVKFVFEPINRRDENAIVVKVKFGSWEPIGYIPGKKIPKITEAISEETITKVIVRNVKYQYIFAISSFKYFASIAVSKKAKWKKDRDSYQYNECVSKGY